MNPEVNSMCEHPEMPPTTHAGDEWSHYEREADAQLAFERDARTHLDTEDGGRVTAQ